MKYKITKKKNKTYISYGVMKGGFVLKDVCISKKDIKAIANILNKYKVPTVHCLDIVEDYLAQN